MICTINYSQNLDPSVAYLLDNLPQDISKQLNDYFLIVNIDMVNEIRIRTNDYISVLCEDLTAVTNVFIDSSKINEIFTNLCDGSVYAHASSIVDGYISLGKGLRAGICGKAVTNSEKIVSIRDISSINIRIPHRVKGTANFLYNLLEDNHFNSSVIIYSPPGVGKTTILRELACLLSSDNKMIRYAIIDTREEITPFVKDKLTADIFLGYPKGLGIELATKSMTPQLIICDEISSKSEGLAILNAIHCGVRLIATTHADSLDELMKKESVKELINAKVFEYALGIKRNKGKTDYLYSLNKLWR